MLQVEGLVAGYGKSEILHGVTLSVRKGEVVCIIGPNGAGKSTVLKSICGLTTIRGGAVRLAGEEITRLKTHLVARKGVGYVPQGRCIFPSLTVLENLELGAYTSPDGKAGERLEGVYERFPILRQRSRQRAGTLSGGEQQMLAIGRALMAEPTVLLLDEPSLGLAPLLVEEVFQKIAEIHRAGTTILIVEQNARRALAIAHRGYVLELGRNRFEGRGADLLDDEQVKRLYLGG